MSIEENLTRAINAHSRWKKLLKTAIESGECSIDVETTSKKDACGFGKWLYTDEEAKMSPHYAIVEQLHAQFHHSAGEILALALSGRQDEARSQMDLDSHSSFVATSTRLVNEFGKWKRGK